MPEKRGDITELLDDWRRGDRAAGEELFSLVLPDLRRLAQYFLKRERPGHPLQPSDLVNTVFMRLLKIENQDWRNRQHFFAFFARAMRWHLIDIAKKGRGVELIRWEDLNYLPQGASPKLELEIMMARLLDEMAGIRPEWCMVVEVKHYLGLTDNEGADALGLKLRSFQRMWRDARQWLFDRIEKDAAVRHSAG
jgi:RNA polymerase sigma factor (TIGR02999 family)